MQREQVKALVSRCVAVLQNVPGKLQSCLQERDEAQQRADEALRAKAEVTGQPMGCSGAASAAPVSHPVDLGVPCPSVRGERCGEAVP